MTTTETVARSVERQAQDIFNEDIWAWMKVIALLALVGGWDHEELSEAIR